MTKKTPLNHIHHRAGAKMIDFGGWEMPVQYTGIIEEHNNVRENCGLFDVSHMGEILFKGKDALAAVQKLITNDASRLEEGKVLYTPMCYSDGGIVDDLLVYFLGEDEYLMVVNAANTEKDYEWILKNTAEMDVEIKNVSDNYAQLALQGPASRELLKELTDIDLENLKFYHFTKGQVAGKEVLLSRTGYTGELGYELYLAPGDAEHLWEELMEIGEKYKLKPVGLGARNTLRLEKGYCLYGNDIDKSRHPLEAGLGWTVKMDKGEFIGKEKLRKYREKGYEEKLAGFKVTGRGIPRHGYKIQYQGEDIGIVTSGSHSPSLEENIGLGYVKKELAKPGTEIEIVVRKRTVKAEIVEIPFV